MNGFRPLKLQKSSPAIPSPMPEFSDRTCISSHPRPIGQGKIFILESALEDLNAHVSWNRKTPLNLVEQGGYMLGQVFEDPVTGEIYALVNRMVPIYGAKGSSTFLEMGADACLEANILEAEIKNQSDIRLKRVGWYHTHPGDLPVFMSGTDMKTQAASYGEDTQFAVVLNPHTRVIRGFRGARALEAECVLVCTRGSKMEALFSAKSRNFNEHTVKEPAAPGQFRVRLEDRGITVGSLTMGPELFLEQVLAAVRFGGRIKGVESICIHGRLKLTVEADRVCCSTLVCERQYINMEDGQQISQEFISGGEDGCLYLVAQFRRNFQPEDLPELLSRMTFRRENQIFAMLDFSEDHVIRYYFCDETRKTVSGTYHLDIHG